MIRNFGIADILLIDELVTAKKLECEGTPQQAKWSALQATARNISSDLYEAKYLHDTKTMLGLIAFCQDFALEHYNDSFEMSAFTECFDTTDWAGWLDRNEILTRAQAKAKMLDEARVRQAFRDDIEATAF